jgi:hypothetical protein
MPVAVDLRATDALAHHLLSRDAVILSEAEPKDQTLSLRALQVAPPAKRRNPRLSEGVSDPSTSSG